jgi:hypothetical protein
MTLATTLVSSLDSVGGDWGSVFPSTSSTSAKPSVIEPKEMIASSSVVASRKSTMSTNLDISRNDVSKFQELEVSYRSDMHYRSHSFSLLFPL